MKVMVRADLFLTGLDVDDANFDSYKFGNQFETAAVPQTHSSPANNFQQTQVGKPIDATKQHFYH
jgi:hypothetical protein